MHQHLVKYELTHYFSLTSKCPPWLIISTAYTVLCVNDCHIKLCVNGCLMKLLHAKGHLVTCSTFWGHTTLTEVWSLCFLLASSRASLQWHTCCPSCVTCSATCGWVKLWPLHSRWGRRGQN